MIKLKINKSLGFISTRSFVYLLLITLTVLVNIAIFKRYYTNQPTVDALLYENTAKSLLQGNPPSVGDDKNTYIDIGKDVTPGYPAFIAVIYQLTGTKPLHVVLTQILLNILTVLIAYELMKKATNQNFALLFSLLFIFYYQIWRFNFFLMMESLTIFLLMLTIKFLYDFFKKRQNKDLIISAILFSVLIFVNNRFIFHFGVLVLFFLALSFFRKEKLIKPALILVVIFTVIMLPWHIRQAIHYKQFVLFTPMWTNVISQNIGIIPKVEVSTNADHVGQIGTYEVCFAYLSTIDNNPDYRKMIYEKFTREKYNSMVQEHSKFTHGFNKYLSRFEAFWQTVRLDFQWLSGGDTRIEPPSYQINLWFDLIISTPIFIFMFLGSIISFIRKDYFFQLLFLLIISHCLVHMLTHYIPRYRITIMPLVIMLGWYGIYHSYSYIKKYNSIRVKKLTSPGSLSLLN